MAALGAAGFGEMSPVKGDECGLCPHCHQALDANGDTGRHTGRLVTKGEPASFASDVAGENPTIISNSMQNG